MKVVNFNRNLKNNTKRIIKELNGKDSIVILPTDTVYGFFARVTYDNWKIINSIKQRDLNTNLTVTFSDLNSALKYLDTNEKTNELLNSNLPGKKTFIVKAQAEEFPFFKDLKKEFVGIRVVDPDMKKLKHIIEEVGPLLSTSCNRTGTLPLFKKQEILNTFKNEDNIKILATSKMVDGSRISSKVFDVSNGKDIRIIR